MDRSLMKHVGHLAQLGGTRHIILDEGQARGVHAIEVNTGAGLCFTVVPDRGMDISRCSFKGYNMVYLGACGETDPSGYDSQGLGWLKGFFGGLLTTCGPTHLGPPCIDEGVALGLHGPHNYTRASRYADLSGWSADGSSYDIVIRGDVEQNVLFGYKLCTTREIRTRLGDNRLIVHDTILNVGDKPSPLTVLYHVNLGYPLMDSCTRLMVSDSHCEAVDENSQDHFDERFGFTRPTTGFSEQNFLYTFSCGAEAARVELVNDRLGPRGVVFYEQFNPTQLPYLNQWRMLGECDYVLGLEPCNVPCESRASLREKGLLPFLEPGESRDFELELGFRENEASEAKLISK